MGGKTPREWGAVAALIGAGCMCASGQTESSGPAGYSIATPRPINPAEGTTNPSAVATQRQNPYLGSVPAKATNGTVEISLQDAIDRGLRYNLGLVESNLASADVRASRLRALSALLPQVSAHGQQAFEDISFKEIGLKLPPIPGLPSLPPTSGAFGYEDARIGVAQSLYNRELRERYRAQTSNELASKLSVKDSRDVVVLAIGAAYLQVIASAARVETAKAQVVAAQELDRLTAHRVTSEVSPEIDSLRAQVQRQSAEQRLTNVANQWEKDKLALARIAGLPIEQKFELTDRLTDRQHPAIALESATEEALRSRADLASAEASIKAAESAVRAEKAQRLPVVSVSADYGGAGINPGNYNQVYSVAGNISVPIYTGGRIRADISLARSELARRQAEYADLKGRIGYDVRVAWLDVSASASSVKVAESNRMLAEKALGESRDRYTNGVTNYLEVVQAQEVVAEANENRIQSLYSFNVAMVFLARAMGNADTRLQQLLEGK